MRKIRRIVLHSTSGWAYVVDQTATGTALNKSIASSVKSGQSTSGTPPRLVILDEHIVGSFQSWKYA